VHFQMSLVALIFDCIGLPTLIHIPPGKLKPLFFPFTFLFRAICLDSLKWHFIIICLILTFGFVSKSKYATLFLGSLIFLSSHGLRGGKKRDTGNEVDQCGKRDLLTFKTIKIWNGWYESWSRRTLLLLKCALLCCNQD